MITDYQKLKIPDEAGKYDLVFEVNYSDAPNVAECQILRITYPDGSQGFLRKDYLMAMLFTIGKAEEQRDLIPKKLVTVRKYKTMLGITATKNIKKGEKINVEVDIPLPPIEKEILEAGQKLAGRYNGMFPKKDDK